MVRLALNDFAREDDAFEVENVEFVIFQFLGRVGGDHVSMLPDEIAKARQGPVGHFGMILSLLSLTRRRG